MICFDSERGCVRLKAFQDVPVRKMAVGGSIPCFVSRFLTLGMIINASTSFNGISELVDFQNDDLFLSRSMLEHLQHTVAPLAAGLTTCAGTFDAGVRVESSSNTG